MQFASRDFRPCLIHPWVAVKNLFLKVLGVARDLNVVLAGTTSHSTCLDTWEGLGGHTLAAVGGVTGGVSIVDLEHGTLVTELGKYV